jgi:DNA-binding IclR family transcriptional regulator
MEQTTGTVEKALDVLLYLHGERRACGVSEIGRALGLPRSTTHRLLAALGSRGLVERQTGGGGAYRPGIALVALGLGVLQTEPVVAAARPVLEAEAHACGETLFLAGARAGRLVVLDKAEGSAFLRASPRVGEAVPAAKTAVGKLHLALAPGLLRERAPSGPGFERELAAVRRHGWAANRDEWITGLTGVAAPVWLGDELAGAIAIAGASARIRTAPRSSFVARVRAAAARVGARLAGREREIAA